MAKMKKISKPLLILNFKAFPESTGKNALKLVKICNQVKSKKVDIWLAPCATDLLAVSQKFGNVLAQAADALEAGAYTGSVPVQVLKACGAKGVLISHSEKKLSLLAIEKTIAMCKQEKLLTIVFAASMEELKAIVQWGPDFVVFEPPELIGSGNSVTSVQPEVINKAVQLVHGFNPNIPVLCGAGVTNGNDIKKALELGTQGVILASAFDKAKNPKKVLAELLKGFG